MAVFTGPQFLPDVTISDYRGDYLLSVTAGMPTHVRDRVIGEAGGGVRYVTSQGRPTRLSVEIECETDENLPHAIEALQRALQNAGFVPR
jgi:hypothetical protein